MKKLFCSLMLIGFASQVIVYAQDSSQWGFIAKDAQGDVSVYFKYGSARFVNSASTGPGITVVAQWSSTLTDMVTYNQETISLSDCRRGIGKLYVYDLDGNFTGEHDYVKGGASMASGVGDALCRIAVENAPTQRLPNPRG